MPEPLELTVELLIDSGRQLQSSMTRLVALNVALLSIIAAIIGWANFDDYELSLIWVVAAVCAFGALGSWFIGGAMLRQVRMARLMRDRIRQLQDEGHPILPREEDMKSASYGAAFVQVARWLVVALWIGLFAEIYVTLPGDEGDSQDVPARRRVESDGDSMKVADKIALSPSRKHGDSP